MSFQSTLTMSIVTLALSPSLAAAQAATSQSATNVAALTVQRIFGDEEFKTKSFGPSAWLDDGTAYTTVEDAELAETEPADEASEDNSDEPPQEIIRYDTATGERQVLVSAEQLTPAAADEPLSIDNYQWSEDKTKLLIFTNTVKVWRDKTRGDYWVLDFTKHTLRQVAEGAEESTLMFAKFDSQADHVGYVRENNIYVESLETGVTTAITDDGTDKLINGTFDWVYEEELGLQDGFRFSPDGKHIAYWQLDSASIQDFYILNNTDGLYPTLIAIPYPKVGTENSSCRIGVVPTAGGFTRWMKIPGDPKNHYLASMEWVTDSQHLLIEQLNRLQNRRILFRADVQAGSATPVFVDEDEAWVDLRHKFDWYKSGTHRLVLSEQDGWRHVYRVALADQSFEQITRGDYDVIDLVGAEQHEDGSGWLYFTAAPDNPVQCYLYRVPIASGDTTPQRVTPDAQPGHHTYDLAPDGKWAFHTYSAIGKPPAIDLVALPSHASVRRLEDNAKVVEKLEQLELGGHEFFRVEIEPEGGSGPLQLDGWMIKPPGFDPSGKKKYPVLFYVYTEPWGQTARDVWGRERYLWHLLLSQRGYLIVTVDNRGTPAPRGRAWRKAIYRKIGIVNVADQAAAARKILAWPFVDESRVGVWGWSGGGSMTLNALFQHPEIYHVGMSVAPVGDERLYDTIYQERYMGLPDDNTEGFSQGSPVTHASKLEGKLLLVHGTGDDNVHYQNAEVVINELIKHNRPFDMMSYPNRSHSIREGDNTRLHLFELLTRYLTTNLPAE